MKLNLSGMKILESAAQIVIVVMCIAGTWANTAISGEMRPVNFLDAAYVWGGYAPTVIVVICAAAAIILCWTPARRWTIIPCMIEMIIGFRTYLYYVSARATDSGGPAPMSILHLIAFFLALTVGTWIFEATRRPKKEGEKNG